MFLNESQMRWLGRVVFENSFIYLDRWSFVHLAIAMIITALLLLVLKKKVWLIVIVLLVIYEIWESHFWVKVWYLETNLNIAWDIIVGSCGMLFVLGLKKLMENEK